MNTWRSKPEQDLVQQVAELKDELEKIKQEYKGLLHQYQSLKQQNERLLRMEAEHQSAKESLIRKRIVLSHAVILVPENMVIGDHMENCVIKIYKGNNLTVTDTGKLINCRIIGLKDFPEEKKHSANKNAGTIEIKGVFYNTNSKRYSISTHGRVLIAPGSRFLGNVRAETIVITELTKVSGKFVSWDLLRQQKSRRDRQKRVQTAKVLEFGVAEGRLSTAHS